MDTVKFIIFFIIAFVMGAVSHERDMEKMCKKYGFANGFVSTIQCNEKLK